MFLKEEVIMSRKNKTTSTTQKTLLETTEIPVAPAESTPAVAPIPAADSAVASAPAPALPKISDRGFKWIVVSVLALLLLANVFSMHKINELEKVVDHDSKVYVYSMENVLLLAGMADENKQYQIEMDKLGKEIDAAQKKLNGMKDKKLKQEYSDMYMKSLTLKRDTLVETHDKFMANLLKNVNRALLTVTAKYKAPTIYTAKSIAVHTPNVIDVTDEISDYLKDNM